MAPAAGTKVHAATSTTLMPSSGFDLASSDIDFASSDIGLAFGDIVGCTLHLLGWEDSIAFPPVVSSPGAEIVESGAAVLKEYVKYDSTSSTPEDVAEFRTGFREWLRDNATVLAEWRGRFDPGGVQPPTLEQEMAHGARLMALLWDAGWGRAGWPEAAGGTGGGSVLRAVLLDELWAHDFEVPHQYEALEVMVPPLVGLRPDLVAAHLPAFASGRECWVQGFSEPEAGSDIASLRTRARLDSDSTGGDSSGGDGTGDFVLNGQKVWGSLGVQSDYAFILARTGTPESRHRGLTMFFLDLHSPGVTVRPIALASGVNHLAEIFLDDVRIPASQVLGEVDGGWATLMRILQYERGSYVWTRQAVLHRRLREVAPDIRVHDDRAAQQLGRAYLNVLAARAQASKTIRRLARGDTLGPETSVDKVVLGSAEHAVMDVVRELRPQEFLFGDTVNLHGWRDNWWYSRAATVFGGAAEVQRGIVADRVLRLPAEGA